MANWLAPFLAVSKLSQEQLADELGVSRATINRLANDHSKLKLDRAREMARLLGTTVEALMLNDPSAGQDSDQAAEIRPSGTGLVPAHVAGTVEAGAWREVDELDQSDLQWISLPPDPRFPNVTQEVYEVSGDSMNSLEPFPILPGSRVVALPYEEIAGRVPLRDRLVVVVQRTRDGGHTRELSIKQVEFYGDRIEFHPRSSNSKHKPIVVQHDSWADNGITVEVKAVVTRTMNELPF
ncbi:helix-turn-helix domain-containing protein [Paradevosia shaoguanensis]|uniref:helix-turn-helix domain-containing protein n=1 Tax=Paradevosia shaoguanensis TaxID=1335043 RepID=UPI00193410AD|nr:helix-turn-helix domain-containing protein [Paradevosia shaoguanensis]